MQEPQETQVCSLGQEDPLEEGMATHSNNPARRTHGQRRLAGDSPWGRQSGTQLSMYALCGQGTKTEAKTTGTCPTHFLSFCFLNCWLLSLGEIIWVILIVWLLKSSCFNLCFSSLNTVTKILCYPI